MPFEVKMKLNLMSEKPTNTDTNDNGCVTVLYMIHNRFCAEGFRPDHRWFRGEYSTTNKGLVLYGWVPGGNTTALIEWHQDFIRGVLESGCTIGGGSITADTPKPVESTKRKIRIDEDIPA